MEPASPPAGHADPNHADPNRADPSRADPSPADDPGILGLDNVQLDLPLAGLGSRCLAVILDQLALLVLMTLFAIATFGVAALLGLFETYIFAVLGLGLFALQWGYFAAFEIALAGQTPGKMTLGLRTVTHLGGRPSPAAVLTRNFLRTFDILIGVPIMAIDRRFRRLGDMVASTLVVHDRDEPSLHLGRVPTAFSPREIAVTESFLARADGMEPDIAQELATRLLDLLRRRQPELAEAPGSSPLEQLRAALEPAWSTDTPASTSGAPAS